MEPKSETGQPYPFLGYQKNSILRRAKKRDDSPGAPEVGALPFFYQKPHQICKTTDQALPMYWKDKNLFAKEWGQQIESYIRYYKLQIRLMKNEDTPGILEFLSRRYPPHIASEISPFDLYRFRNFGHGILLEDSLGKIQGTIFEELYGTAEKTSYTMRLAVSEDYKGKNLGYHVMIFSSLKAMEQGARVKRGLIEFFNLRSLHVNLNKVGWICDGFEPNISGLGAFFKIALPLDPRGLTSNVIDTNKVMDFVQNHSPENDYRLIAAGDYDGICDLYETTDFKVAALLHAGIAGKEAYFLALPRRSLQMNTF
ncbi:MAG: hypothetical protein SF052_07690 [Bacteroidia bacterium]|nr:hypothetical protein [Bacteroidia bacterium]